MKHLFIIILFMSCSKDTDPGIWVCGHDIKISAETDIVQPRIIARSRQEAKQLENQFCAPIPDRIDWKGDLVTTNILSCGCDYEVK
jgi:hypothetical protein